MDEFDDLEKDKPDDFITVITEKIYGFDWVILLSIAISFIFVVSDFYNEHAISRRSGNLDINDNLTTKGYMFQLISLLIGTIISRIVLAFAGI